MLLQAHLYFVIYSIGIDFASLVVKIKIFGCWGGVLPKVTLNPINSHKSMYYTLYCKVKTITITGIYYPLDIKVNNDHHKDLLPLGH